MYTYLTHWYSGNGHAAAAGGLGLGVLYVGILSKYLQK